MESTQRAELDFEWTRDGGFVLEARCSEYSKRCSTDEGNEGVEML